MWINNYGGGTPLNIEVDGDEGAWFLTITDEDGNLIVEALTYNSQDLNTLVGQARDAL